MMHLI